MIYTGARGEELAQLASGDVRNHRGTPYLQFHDRGDNKLKNSSSMRLIPIHQRLLDAGFMAFVESRKGAPFLFKSLEPDGRDRRYSRMQKRVNALIRNAAKITDPQVIPYSLRHTWKDSLRVAHVPEEIADRLMGHTSPDRAVPTGYGSPDQVVVLAEWVNKADPLDQRRQVVTFTAEDSDDDEESDDA